MNYKHGNGKGFLALLIAGFLLTNLMPLSCLAIAIPDPSKNGNLQLDGYARMDAGAGPTTNDISNTSPDGGAQSSQNLAPLTLNGDSASGDSSTTSGESSSTDNHVLNATVRQTVVAPHEPNEQVLEEASVAPTKEEGKGGKHKHGKAKKSLSEQGKDVAVGPLPLLTSDRQDQQTAEFINTAEKEQISDLWESTLARSPDIQFVIQKLQPTSNQAHLSAVLTRLLGAAMYGGMGASMFMMPNGGMASYAMMSGGYSAISSVMGIAQKNQDKKAKLSQEEQMMMLQIVRNTADKLVASYRDYKKFFVSLARSSNDLQDLQAMAAEARAGQDASKQLEMDYTLRKAQRDVDQISDDVRRNRANLIDLAGGESVAKLDKQIIWEQTQVDQGATTNPEAPAPAATPASTDTPPASDKKGTQAEDPNGSGDKPKTASSDPSPQS
jgi:uncharacterized membrane protein